MKYKGTIISEASGRLGGIVFSHNRGGPYIRAGAIPTNPSTTQQQVVRSAMAGLTSRWQDTLTQGQRDGWDNYALNVPIPNAQGDPINVGGLGMYARSNVSRIQAGLVRRDFAPATLNLGSFTPPLVTGFDPDLQTIDLSFTEADEWVTETGAAMLVYISRGLPTSINFFKGPYQFAGLIAGDSSSPPTSPATIAAPFAFNSTDQLRVQVRVSRNDGRLSSANQATGSLPQLEQATFFPGTGRLLLRYDRNMDAGTTFDAGDVTVRQGGTSWSTIENSTLTTPTTFEILDFTSGLAQAGESASYTRTTSDAADLAGLLAPDFSQIPIVVA